MKDFPQESIEQARWVVDKYRRRTNSKLDTAAKLYDNQFIQIAYGFSEAIKKGNCGLYFHEIDKECDCFTYLGAAYLVAREADLKPKMWWGVSMKDQGEGEDLSEIDSLDHGFVTVEVGKDKNLLIDRQMGLYGFAKFNRKKHIIEVYDKQDKKITYRHYQHLAELSQNEYLEKLEKNRSSEGGRIVLSTTQRIRGVGNKQVYLTYTPETHELKSSIRFPTIRFGPDSYNKVLITDIVTNVNKDGTYDFKDGDLSFYHASVSGWSEHENPQLPLTIPIKDAEKVWKICDEIFREQGRKSRVRGNALKALEDIKDAGFNDDFSVRERSRASKVIGVDSLESALEEFQRAQRKSINEYVQTVPANKLSYKSLLRHAHIVKAYDRAKSKENPKGFVFSDKEHVALLEKEFENFKQVTWRVFNTVVEQTRIKVGLKKGSLYHAERGYNKAFAKESRNIRYFDIMGQVYKSRFPLAFHIAADKELSSRQFDLDKMSVNRLGKGLTQKDVKRAAQHRLFEWLIGTYVVKEGLFLASYKKGLQRILDRR